MDGQHSGAESQQQQLRIVLDARERALIEEVGKRQPIAGACAAVEVKNLDLGDAQVWAGRVPAEQQQLVLVLERKTFADLLASVKDGRYVEQKDRSLAQVGNMRYVYVVEGAGFAYGDAPFAGLELADARRLQTCVLNSMLRDGIRVMFTAGVKETADLLLAIAERAMKQDAPLAYFRCLQGEQQQPHAASAAYKAALQVRRRDNLCSPRTIAELQVAQVPGVSVSNASAILDGFGVTTLAQLARKLEALPDPAARVKALMSVPKIGRKKAEHLVDMLFAF